MMSKIEWTEVTWNPVVGCAVLSPGCTNCYAMRMAARCELMGHAKYDGTTRKSGGRSKWTGLIRCDPTALQIPYRWKSPKTVFVNSMSDLMHEGVPLAFISKVMGVMRETDRHDYQVLTKRPERLAEIDAAIVWPANMWMGVSVESADYLWRIDLLRRSGAAIKFLSLEPLLGPLTHLDLAGIDWVIVGGESGPGARPMSPDWVREIRNICAREGVPFFFKQWGGVRKATTGRTLDGLVWNEYPL